MKLETLQKGMVSAMKNKDKIRKDTISSLIGAVKKAAIDAKCDRDNIPENIVDAVLLKEQKSMQEMIDTCPAERVETLNEYQSKMEIIKEFAPQLLNKEEDIEAMILQIANDASVELSKANKGMVMKTIMPQLKGKVDMKVAQRVLNSLMQ